jgi:hypothetical protein
MYQIPHVMQPIAIGGILANQIRLFHRVTAAIGDHPVRQLISPGILLSLHATTRRPFPFGFRGETIRCPAHFAQPLTVCGGFKPTDGHHGLMGMVEARIIPTLREGMSHRPQEARIFPISDRVLAEGESTHPYPVHRPLIFPTDFTAHQKRTFRDVKEFRANHSR